MTPLHIQMMLHYYIHPPEYPYGVNDHLHAYSPTVIEYRNWLVEEQMLDTVWKGATHIGYKITDKGKAYVEALKAVKIPVIQWVQPGEEM